jgi:hypothetical protein
MRVTNKGVEGKMEKERKGRLKYYEFEGSNSSLVM